MDHRDLISARPRPITQRALWALALGAVVLLNGCTVAPAVADAPAAETAPEEAPRVAADEALLTAAAAGDLPGVVSRLDAGAAIEGRDADGRTALMVATAANRSSMVEFLLSHGADLEARDDAGNTALFLAPASGPRMVQRLLEHEASATAINTAGHGPLTMAVQAGDLESVVALLDAEAPVDTSGELDGYGVVTPLLLAVDGGHADIIQRLVAKGADPHLRDAEGRTALDRAKDAGHPELLEVLARAARKELRNP